MQHGRTEPHLLIRWAKVIPKETRYNNLSIFIGSCDARCFPIGAMLLLHIVNSIFGGLGFL